MEKSHNSHQKIDAPPPVPLAGERVVHTLLGELQRLTGLESTYVTRIDADAGVQEIVRARNTGAIDVAEGMRVAWSDTVCRLALERGQRHSNDVPADFPESRAAAALGLQTYVSVPLLDERGELQGTLCGASRARVPLGARAIDVMASFGQRISDAIDLDG